MIDHQIEQIWSDTRNQFYGHLTRAQRRTIQGKLLIAQAEAEAEALRKENEFLRNQLQYEF